MANKRSPEREIYQQALIDMISCRPVAYWPRLARLVGGVKAAVMLSQLLYWNGDQIVIQRDGWILKSVDDLENETGLTRLEQLTARSTLQRRGLIECQLRGIPRIWYYRVDVNALSRLLIEPQSHSMEDPFNGEPMQHCTTMSRNIARETDETFSGKPLQLNKVLETTEERLIKTTTSSSSAMNADTPGEPAQPAKGKEEEVPQKLNLSTEAIQALREIGIFDSLLPEIAATGIPEDTLMDLIDECEAKEPTYGKLAGLFMYRLRNRPLSTETTEERRARQDQAQRNRYVSGAYADIINH